MCENPYKSPEVHGNSALSRLAMICRWTFLIGSAIAIIAYAAFCVRNLLWSYVEELSRSGYVAATYIPMYSFYAGLVVMLCGGVGWLLSRRPR